MLCSRGIESNVQVFDLRDRYSVASLCDVRLEKSGEGLMHRQILSNQSECSSFYTQRVRKIAVKKLMIKEAFTLLDLHGHFRQAKVGGYST